MNPFFKAIAVLSLLLATGAEAAKRPAGRRGAKPTAAECARKLTPEEMQAEAAPTLPPGEAERYFNFIKTNLRLPSPAEVREMGITPIARKHFFGDWGAQLLEESDANLAESTLSPERVSNSSIFNVGQVQTLVGLFYKKLKEMVSDTNIYPPTFLEFARYAGFEQESDVKLFKAMFDRRTGLFRGYLESFKSTASRWNGMGPSNFFSRYVDQTVFNAIIRDQLIDDIRSSPAFFVAGFVSGQPVPTGIEDALYTMQQSFARSYNGTVPVITAPSYGLASGVPERLSAPAEHRYVCPQSIFLQDVLGNATSINEVALPNRALTPQTGLVRMIKPGKQLVVVHPQSIYLTQPTDGTPNSSAVVTTGALNKAGFNVSTRAIGARISSIQNELHSNSILIIEKITGEAADHGDLLEASFRIRSIPFLDREMTVTLPDGSLVSYPKGFIDLNKLYGVDGKIYNLPIYQVVFGDTHSPVHDRGYLENFYRQFIDPVSGLKNTDGSPADIYSFAFNDHFNGDYISRHTEDSLSAQQHLVHDDLERDLDLHLRKGVEIQKDLQFTMQRTRGYVPMVYYMSSNHDQDRVNRKIGTGRHIGDIVNARIFNRMQSYRDEGKNPLREYLMNDIGVGYNDHVQVMAPGEKLAISNLAVSHGHTGGAFGRPVSDVVRRAAQGPTATGHTHMAGWNNGKRDAGNAALHFDYASDWFSKVKQAAIVITPLHAQVVFYEKGSFIGASTHGNAEFEFRPGFPRLQPLPVETHTLPATANTIDQYR